MVLHSQSLYGSLYSWIFFCNKIKAFNIGVRYKSRLVSQNYDDDQEATILWRARTVHWLTQRLIWTMAALLVYMITHVRNIALVNIQCYPSLQHHVDIRPSKKMNLPPNKGLNVTKPLYGIQESGLYGYLTCVRHYMSSLDMHLSGVDLWLLYKKMGDILEALVIF